MTSSPRLKGDFLHADPPEQTADSLSLPLYAAGLIVTLCGVLTVTTELDATGISRVALLLTGIGFAFSLACRRLQVPALWLHLGALAFVAFLVAGAFPDGLAGSWFLGGAGGPDMRLAVLLMWAGVLRAWTLVSDDLVLSCCVTTAAMIGLIGTQTPNTEVLVYFCIFVLAMTFMLIHQNYLHFRARASVRERARPMGLMLTAQLLISVFSVVFVLSAGALLIVPAQAVLANLSLSQAIRRLVGTGPARESLPSGATRFSDTTTMDIGQAGQWPTSSDVLLHVAPDDNQPHYWLGRTYDKYEGTGWRSTLDMSSSLPLIGDAPSMQLYLIRSDMPGQAPLQSGGFPRRQMVSTVEVRGETDQFYYCQEARALITGVDTGAAPSLNQDGRIDLSGRPVEGTYSVRSLPPPDPSLPEFRQKLRSDGTDYPPEVRRLYLNPSQTDGISPHDLEDYRTAVADAVRPLPPNGRTPYDEAMALRDWIANRCTYSLAVSAMSPDTDHVHEFLFHTRRGYCDLFASSLVILCRVAGIPARVATGFAPGDRDATGFNLRALDKHAWAEVFFPSDRWQVFDATVGTRTDGTVPTGRPDAASWWQRFQQTLRVGGPLPVILVSLIAVLVLFVLKTEVYDRRRRATSFNARIPLRPSAQLGDQYAQMAQALSRLGLPRRPSETPAEYEARAVPFLTSLEPALGVPLTPAVVSEMTRRLVAVRYAGGDSSAASGFDDAFARWIKATTRARLTQLWRRLWRAKG